MNLETAADGFDPMVYSWVACISGAYLGRHRILLCVLMAVSAVTAGKPSRDVVPPDVPWAWMWMHMWAWGRGSKHLQQSIQTGSQEHWERRLIQDQLSLMTLRSLSVHYNPDHSIDLMLSWL